jgi:hypothetical protein
MQSANTVIVNWLTHYSYKVTIVVKLDDYGCGLLRDGEHEWRPRQ